jgi:hypothetical protein
MLFVSGAEKWLDTSPIVAGDADSDGRKLTTERH